MSVKIPAYQTLAAPVFMALKQLGGLATIKNIDDAVITNMDFLDEVISEPHSQKNSKSELSYRLVWSRTLLKKKGIIDNPKRGTWAIKAAYINANESDIKKIIKEQI